MKHKYQEAIYSKRKIHVLFVTLAAELDVNVFAGGCRPTCLSERTTERLFRLRRRNFERSINGYIFVSSNRKISKNSDVLTLYRPT